ncbi:hypothetical protein Rvan_2466 [Rhodomicrobium vannielii ATCC 17100]|uniref:Uncharacterized protein n=1 Tax=Rhodomicrobium vannielii (strain ATCC 17100 / DSM 162 / LMG 4299 / NCIMB 10020 / ATH 3.1.1) TaxID=648757 RepID=E3I5G1_RHOVT|nr:hypothetical protein [Rhodomicrobium vannielii]ADP71682.1 hypothetical protein Rvan_2466 [Rhodomicrobium vannielii ATCC 17100]
MIFAAIIPPTVLGKILEECLRLLLAVACKKYEDLPGDQLDALPMHLADDPSRHALIVARAPKEGMLRELADPRIFKLAVVDSPRHAVEFVRTPGMKFTDCVRHVSGCLAASHDWITRHAPVILDRHACAVPLADFIWNIARIYRLTLTEKDLAFIVEKLASELEPRSELTLGALREWRSQPLQPLNDIEAYLVEASLGPYEAVTDKPVDRLVWPGALFFPEGNIDGYSNKFDLTGRSRILIYGPSHRLPVGHWKAVPVFSVDGNESGNTLVVDVYNGEIQGCANWPLPSRGKFTCEIGFHNLDPGKEVEVRFAIGQGAIEGELEIEHVIIERVAGIT